MNSMNTNTVQNKFPITLFVYGTLKTGYWNFERYCRNAVNIKPATVWGRLWQLPAGYPAIEVPEASILAHGTDGPVADALTQERLADTFADLCKPEGDWDLVHGEIMTFFDPEHDLPPIDRLEGFSPVREAMYKRALVPACLDVNILPIWLYYKDDLNQGVRLSSGEWNRQTAEMIG